MEVHVWPAVGRRSVIPSMDMPWDQSLQLSTRSRSVYDRGSVSFVTVSKNSYSGAEPFTQTISGYPMVISCFLYVLPRLRLSVSGILLWVVSFIAVYLLYLLTYLLTYSMEQSPS